MEVKTFTLTRQPRKARYYMSRIRIDPLVPQAQSLRDALASRSSLLDGERDVGLLVEETRRQMRERFGADVDQPQPKVARTRPADTHSRVSLAPGSHHDTR